MKFLLIILIPLLSHAGTEIEDAKRSIQSLIYPLLQNSKDKASSPARKFRVDACDKKKINWTNVLLMKEKAELVFKYKEGCDIEGTIAPKIFEPFPADLNLRNIESYTNIKSMNRITADLQMKPILNLDMKDGVLTGTKNNVKFEADYRVQMNPMKTKNPVEKNLGGELRITELNGKKVMIKEKILIE